MKYFCARCQQKYDIGDIAADMYDICGDEIRQRLQEIVNDKTESNRDRDAYLYRLIRMCSDESETVGRFFAISGNSAETGLDHPARTGMILRGRLRLSVNRLVSIYKQSGLWSADRESNNVPTADPAVLLKDDLGKTVYEEDLQFVYGEAGPKKELYLDYYMDSENNPFGFTDEYNNNILRGFRRCCPHCGRRLAAAVGKASEIVVALSGSPRSGKTSSIVSMASVLRSGKYQPYGLSMESFNNDEQWQNLQREINNYDRGVKVTKTETSVSSAFSYSVLVRAGNVKRVLTFVDMPGEFWQNQSGNGLTSEFFKQYSGLYENIDCIWFFISKLTAYGYDLGDDLSRNDTQRRLLAESSDVPNVVMLDGPDNLYANLRLLGDSLKARGKEIPPCAVILTKTEIDVSDADKVKEYGLFPVENGKIATTASISSYNVNELKKVFVADGSGGYHLGERAFHSYAMNTRNFFLNSAPGIAKAFEDNLKYRFYIAAAFYGHRAVSEEDIDKAYNPTPFHELFPLIWTLSIMGSLQISHPCVWNTKNWLGAYKQSSEGSVGVTFFSKPYMAGEKPKTGTPEQKEDKFLLYQDIGANLLLVTDEFGKINYRQTSFDHKRSE